MIALFKVRHLFPKVPRLIAGVVGVILLAAAVLKSIDMQLFIRQIEDYGIITHPYYLLVVSAWFLIALEFTLGIGLVVFYRPNIRLFQVDFGPTL